jgi:hypothetical protein
MRLDENAVDLLEINNAGLSAHRFQEAADAEVARTAQGRRSPSPERTMSARASALKVLWPKPARSTQA